MFAATYWFNSALAVFHCQQLFPVSSQFACCNYLMIIHAALCTEFGRADALCHLFFPSQNEPRPNKFLLQVHHKSLSLGEVLDGDRMAESLYHIRFRENVEKKTLCQLTLTETQVFIYKRPVQFNLTVTVTLTTYYCNTSNA